MNYFIDPEKPVPLVCKDGEVRVWLKEGGGKTYRMFQLSDGTFGFEEEIEALRAALEK